MSIETKRLRLSRARSDARAETIACTGHQPNASLPPKILPHARISPGHVPYVFLKAVMKLDGLV